MDNFYFSVSLVQSLSCPCWDIPKEEQDCPTKEKVRSRYILDLVLETSYDCYSLAASMDILQTRVVAVM